MRYVWSGVVVVVVGMALGAAGPVGARPQVRPEVTGYAVLGLDAVTLRPRVRVEAGSVGANRGTVLIGRGTRIAGAVAADIVRLGHNVQLGSLACRILEGAQNVTGCGPLTAPLVASDRLTLVQALAGATVVTVPSRASTAPLAPGAYGEVSVARHGLLLLAGGNYDVRSITLAPHGNLLCIDHCRIRVQDRVLLRRGARLGAAAPATTQDVRVDIEGNRSDPAFKTDTRAQVSGTVYAPRGDIVLGSRGRYDGAFVAATVTVGSAARVTAANGF